MSAAVPCALEGLPTLGCSVAAALANCWLKLEPELAPIRAELSHIWSSHHFSWLPLSRLGLATGQLSWLSRCFFVSVPSSPSSRLELIAASPPAVYIVMMPNCPQVATLNGYPYIVRHVPQSLNSHEAEFEGLLCGNNSSTKVISFGHGGPVK